MGDTKRSREEQGKEKERDRRRGDIERQLDEREPSEGGEKAPGTDAEAEADSDEETASAEADPETV